MVVVAAAAAAVINRQACTVFRRHLRHTCIVFFITRILISINKFDSLLPAPERMSHFCVMEAISPAIQANSAWPSIVG